MFPKPTSPKFTFSAVFLLFFISLLAGSVAMADCTCQCTDDKAAVTVTAAMASGAGLSESEYCKTKVCSTAARPAIMQSCQTISGSNNTPDNKPISILNPLSPTGGPIEPQIVYARIIAALLAFVGVAALVAFVYAGFMFLVSAGNPERIKKAKDTMLYAVIGVFIAMASYAILSFILTTLERGTGN